jgi:hypothetical protein
MTNYALTLNGRTFTPDGQTKIEDPDAHNKAVEAEALRMWQTKPERFLAYYKFPVVVAPNTPCSQQYRETFSPLLRVGAQPASVSTWLGTQLGTIVHARVYRHNFGGRMVSMTVKGNNGATYYGRASWDSGNCINLRKAKS